MENGQEFWNVFGTDNLRKAFDYHFNDLKSTGHLMGFKAGVRSMPGNESLQEAELREKTLDFILPLLREGILIARIREKDLESSEEAIEEIRREWNAFPPRDPKLVYRNASPEEKELWDAETMFEREYVKFTYPENGWVMRA
jgi:hypothetical protein